MDIEGLGEKNIELLYDNKLVRHFTDIYKLKETDLLNLPRFAEKSAHNLILAIDKSKKTTLARFILSLGITFVGEYSTKLICQNFKNLKDLMSAEDKDLRKIDQIGVKVANSLTTFFNDEQNINVLEKLGAEVLDLSNPDFKKTPSSTKVNKDFEMPFNNLTFVITGTLPKGREEVKKYIEQRGGRLSSSISKKTSYLIVGVNPASKLKKAENLGVNRISYDELIKM